MVKYTYQEHLITLDVVRSLRAMSAIVMLFVVLSAGVLTCQTVSAAQKWLNPSDPNVVSYTEASSYLDQNKVVEGTIVYTYVSSGGIVWLYFHNPYKGYFYAIIFSSTKNFNFPPATFYLNKEVRISGTIKLYNGDPEITVNSPAQIEVANMGFNYP
jgi:DNA/RNA endonuclease YhcR with UshA esterase domain